MNNNIQNASWEAQTYEVSVVMLYFFLEVLRKVENVDNYNWGQRWKCWVFHVRLGLTMGSHLLNVFCCKLNK